MLESPAKPSRIALINPTKFLGNLLLSGGLVQHLARWCRQQEVAFLVVLDGNFSELAGEILKAEGAEVVYYPRSQLSPGRPSFNGLRAWTTCMLQIRQFKADLAFTIEEDSVSHRLAHFSGAKRKVSCTYERYHIGFDQILDIVRGGRAEPESSIWYAYRDVLRYLHLPVTPQPGYLDLNALPAILPPDIQLDHERPLALIHAGASKVYKKWPVENFAELASMLEVLGYSIGLVGAGPGDRQVNAGILATTQANLTHCQDFTDRLSWLQLAALMRSAALMVGNDSGPSHLGSALGLPGVVIFGPTDHALWRPLGNQTRVLTNQSACAPDCSRHTCSRSYACLRQISAAEVLQTLSAMSVIQPHAEPDSYSKE